MSLPFTPSQDDTSLQILQRIFGDVVGHVSGISTSTDSTTEMLAAAFQYFNSGVLFFGVMILSWVTVFGIANSANDGQVLGKKWSTFYTPLRTLSASALLIPSTSGFSGIQILVLTFVSWSIGFASNMWSQVVEHTLVGEVAQQASKSIIEDKQFDVIALSAIKMQVCASAVSVAMNSTMSGLSNPINLRAQIEEGRPITDGAKTTYSTRIYFKDPNWPISSSFCGEVKFKTTFTKPDTNDRIVGETAAALQDAIKTTQYKYYLSLFCGPLTGMGCPSGITTAGGHVLEPIIRKILVASYSTDNTTTISGAEVQEAIKNTRKAMMADIRKDVERQVANANNAAIKRMTERGWAWAGSLHMEVSRIKDAVRSAVASGKAEITEPNWLVDTALSLVTANAVQNLMVNYRNVTSLVTTAATQAALNESSDTPSMPSIKSSFELSDFTDGGTSILSAVKSQYNKLGDSVVHAIVYYIDGDSTDALWQVKNLGDYLAAFGETIITANYLVIPILEALLKGVEIGSFQSVLGTNGAAVGAVAGAAIQGVLSAIIQFWDMLAPSLFTITYAGYFLGIWVPMIPFYIFFIGVVGWVIVVIEAVAASSLFAVMHMTPESNDSFIGSQQQGYLLLMSVFFRPPLMILGLVASIAVLNPIVSFLNEAFMLSFRVLQTDSFTSLIQIAGTVLVYCFILISIFSLTFALPQTLPDRILRWVGAGIGDLGEQQSMNKVESAASGSARMAYIAGNQKEAGLKQARRGEESARKAQADQSERDQVQQRIAASLEGLGGQSSVTNHGGSSDAPPDMR